MTNPDSRPYLEKVQHCDEDLKLADCTTTDLLKLGCEDNVLGGQRFQV